MYQMVKKCDDMCIRLDTVPQCDRETDRHRQMVKQYGVLHGDAC